jgi:Predicted DNA-binding protein with PD1-like DNA-binding motif
MKYAREGKHIILKLDSGDEIIPSIEKLLQIENVKNGYILSGLGAGTGIEIGSLVGKTYVNETLDQRHEIIGFNGSITEGNPRMHIHITLAGEDHIARGGHLFKGKADPLMEVAILVLDEIKMTRKLEAHSGMNELSFV